MNEIEKQLELQTWREKILDMPQPDRDNHLSSLEFTWELDWDILHSLYTAGNLTDEEIKERKRTYREKCREQLLSVGYCPMFFN